MNRLRESLDVLHRNEIPTLISSEGGQQFAGHDFRALRQPGVYLFMLGDVPLYVGMSSCLLQRMGAKAHAQASKAMQDCDRVLLYPCRNVGGARRLESILIKRLQPKYNQRLRLYKRAPAICM